MASQKPPVALVRRVTLNFSLGAPLPLPDGAALLPDWAAVLPAAAMSIAPAPSTINAFSRVDM
jgi:hypothetical protein